MKPKIICLLAVLFCCNMIASPNRYINNEVQCDGKVKKPLYTTPVKKAVMMIDEMELLPLHHYLNNL